MRFRYAHWFLSNFYPHKIIAWGIEYPTAEHVYVATKTLDAKLRRKISKMKTPGQAKRFGRKLTVHPDWENNKVLYMYGILKHKFSNNYLLDWLKKIDGEIIEHNTWHDNFWGVCICNKCINKEKRNILGKLLMKIRDKKE